MHSRELQHLMLRARRKLDWDWLQTMVAGVPWKIANAVDPDKMLIDACRRQDAGEQGVIDPFGPPPGVLLMGLISISIT